MATSRKKRPAPGPTASSPQNKRLSPGPSVGSTSAARAPLRYGMVGGGVGSWIGRAHRAACSMDSTLQLTCGVFSSTLAKSQQLAAAWGTSTASSPPRVYGSCEDMVAAESQMPQDTRISFIVVCTPNRFHYQQVKTCLQGGFHVVVDKPLATTVEQAKELVELVQNTGLLLALTHTYSGYPMIKEAREQVQGGSIGDVRKVVVEYPQGWLVPAEEKASNVVSSLVDVGTHAHHMTRYITGLAVKEVFCDATTFVGSARAPDDYNVLLRFKHKNGSSVECAKGVLIASQCSTGDSNPFRIRVYGSNGSIDWIQEDPGVLVKRMRNQPVQILKAGSSYLSDAAKHNTRLPAGHPEAYIEAFANIYGNFAACVRARLNESQPPKHALDFPVAADGLAGLQFVSAVEQSAANGQWVESAESL